ncbi:MAG TPA: nuclease-related domain-containing protein [Steroidobacteraceae bacterium]|nr:nuclease-related domain-containing protein [Steroidobacteraceae bacterium]
MNPPFGLTQVEFILVVVGAIVVALLGLLGSRAWVVRRRDARRVARVTAGAADFLRNVLVPDGNGGDYHLDFVLLTSRGIVVIDMRDITGNVFGGDQMTAWTLMSGPSRTTFVNPQAGLYDRIASVKAIATDTPIEGRIVFTKHAKFPKGLPRFTVMLESVASEFPKLGAAELEIAVSKYRPGWARLKEAAKPSPHFRNNPIAVA